MYYKNIWLHTLSDISPPLSHNFQLFRSTTTWYTHSNLAPFDINPSQIKTWTTSTSPYTHPSKAPTDITAYRTCTRRTAPDATYFSVHAYLKCTTRTPRYTLGYIPNSMFRNELLNAQPFRSETTWCTHSNSVLFETSPLQRVTWTTCMLPSRFHTPRNNASTEAKVP